MGRAERFARISTTRLGFFTTYTGGLIIILASLPLWGAILVYPVITRDLSDAAGWLRLIAMFVLPVVELFAIRFAVDRWSQVTYRRVRAWAGGLPFRIDNLESMLAADPPRAGVVTVRMQGDVELEPIAAAVMALGRRWVSAQVQGGGVVVTHGCLGLRDDAGPQAPATNHPYLRFVRGLIDPLLLALHQTTPIASVEIAARG